MHYVFCVFMDPNNVLWFNCCWLATISHLVLNCPVTGYDSLWPQILAIDCLLAMSGCHPLSLGTIDWRLLWIGRSVGASTVIRGFKSHQDPWPYFSFQDFYVFWNRTSSSMRGEVRLLLVTSLLQGVTWVGTHSLTGPLLHTRACTHTRVCLEHCSGFKVKVTLQLMVSWPISPGVSPHLGPKTRFLLLSVTVLSISGKREDGSIIYCGHNQ
jgi:hypothetical protein